jgi:hypothetical protein
MTLILVDDVVFSEECFNWFNKNELLARSAGDNDLPIDVFRFLLPKEYISGVYRKGSYQELTADEFFALLHEIFMLLSDIHKTKSLPVSVTVQDIRNELSKTEKMILFWGLSQAHEPSTLGKISDVYTTSEGFLNNRFCLDAYHIAFANKWCLDKLEGVLNGRHVKDMKQYEQNSTGFHVIRNETVNEFGGNDDAMCRFIKDLVRLGYGGDFDEFIINVKDRIAAYALGPYHYKIALARGYELLGITDFEDINPSEAWRRLFTSYFDGEEDNYDVFFNTYKYHCISFLLLDYLSIEKSGGIDYIPVYKLFSNNGFETSYTGNVTALVNTSLIRSQLFRLYKKKV